MIKGAFVPGQVPVQGPALCGRGTMFHRIRQWTAQCAAPTVVLYAIMGAILLSTAPTAAQSSSDSDHNAPGAGSLQDSQDDIVNLDIEQLGRVPVVVPSMDIMVTSVAKEESTVGRSAAAVFVITQDMIRRSGATCIPEALRMAPGVEVAQINSSTWAISCRGFNNRNSNKLLVMIDGRTVYNQVTSGVLWDHQDYLLEDIDRIEVIRGPGGTLWGANAVNGVINIITKKAGDTQGAYVMAGGGTHERLTDGVRYGGKIGEDCYYRVYGKQFDRGPNFSPTGPQYDSWWQARFGFRADWTPGGDEKDTVTVQGDHYVGDSGTCDVRATPGPPYGVRIYGDTRSTGENALLRWRHVTDNDSDWTLQAYYDNFTLNDPNLFGLARTHDVDFQYHFVADRHSITWGASFRNVYTVVTSQDNYAFHMTPSVKTLNTTTQFIEDTISLSEDLLTLTLGCKLEQTPYTENQYQPTIRMLYTPDRRHSLWGAVSRAVRTPSRTDEEVFLTIPQQVMGAIPRVYGDNSYN